MNKIKKYGDDYIPFIQEEDFTKEELPIASLIQQRRLQILIHSCIYYQLNSNAINDKTFDKWAKELYALQKEYPVIAEKICFHSDFKDWHWCTGAFLPLTHKWVLKQAQYILKFFKYK